MGTTCLYGVYDPVTGILSVASAGHPTPAIAGTGEPATRLDLPIGPPLGIGGLPFESTDIHLPEGSRIALYTDGLVQDRAHDADVGLKALTRAMDCGRTSLAETCDSIIATRSDGLLEDDAALLLVRVHALDADSMFGEQVPRDPSAVAATRTHAGRQLEKWGLQDMTFTAELVVSELVTNAIRYGEEPISLRRWPHLALPAPRHDRGRGGPRTVSRRPVHRPLGNALLPGGKNHLDRVQARGRHLTAASAADGLPLPAPRAGASTRIESVVEPGAAFTPHPNTLEIISRRHTRRGQLCHAVPGALQLHKRIRLSANLHRGRPREVDVRESVRGFVPGLPHPTP
ncbi:SpoIIE family protein phosphatase [Streptomyces sp. SP18BB07]|uniref:SpoIIE family protein phosphatase n=1 Tax=Streptomyces sp. SP18BB07 TaxID=3002522 RepID=UPI003FCDF581